MKKQSQQVSRKNTDIKSKLEDAILGAGSARSEMIMRRRGNAAQLLSAGMHALHGLGDRKCETG